MPAGLLPWVKPQFCDSAGDPVASGRLYAFITRTATPQATYSDAALTIANANPILLNAAGESLTSIYLRPVGYTVRLDDADGVPLWTVDDVLEVGGVAPTLEVAGTAGGKAVISGYAVRVTDRLVRVASTGGPDPCVITLPPAATATQAVVIKNTGTVPLSVVPHGRDGIDGVQAPWMVAAAVAGPPPVQATIWLAPDGGGGWCLLASHG